MVNLDQSYSKRVKLSSGLKDLNLIFEKYFRYETGLSLLHIVYELEFIKKHAFTSDRLCVSCKNERHLWWYCSDIAHRHSAVM